MASIVVELTNRCNLSCRHCFAGRHGGRDDLPLEVLDKLLAGAKELGIERLAFTGGEPTLHPRFPEIVRRTSEAGYEFSLVTNGQNFPSIYAHILPYRQQLGVVTFSLDGATEETHEHLRGKGAYIKVLQAVSICVVDKIPFTFNFTVTAHNRHELEDMARLATNLGSHGLRFGHLLPTPSAVSHNLTLSPEGRKAVEKEIRDLRRKYPLPVAMAPGYYTTELFPCAPLQGQELNVDCLGRLSKCCHLSSQGDGAGQRDVLVDLNTESLHHAYRYWTEENRQFHRRKESHFASGTFVDTDFFPCWYCSLYYRKVDWLRETDNRPWAGLVRELPAKDRSSYL